jgi:hypothetical protein
MSVNPFAYFINKKDFAEIGSWWSTLKAVKRFLTHICPVHGILI